PSFTTGKLRGMHRLMNHTIEKFCDHLDRLIDTTDGCINAKELATGFTIDTVASTMFATETNAVGGDKKNVFLMNAFAVTKGNMWRIFARMALPRVINKMIGNSTGLNENVLNFFIQLSRQLIK